jgi:hypothetical protein
MTEEAKVIPEEFSKVIKDFIEDLKTTFPEYLPLINKWWKKRSDFDYIEEDNKRHEAIQKSERTSIEMLFSFCQKKIPPRFFDILYQNADMFKEDSDFDTEFLPHIHFKNLWQCEITEKTRETIWKYLQLIMFSIVGTLNNKEAFGDTAKLFEAVNEDEFKSKLEETLSHIQGLFDLSGNFGESSKEGSSGINMENIPNAEEINDHITGMLDGKLGQLAKEIAEETANNLNLDMENVSDMKDVFQQLVKNPTKLMGLVKTVGDKLDSRIKSGEIKESELISEATEMMNKMKNMPGMGNIQSMLSKMGLGGLGGLGGKVNMGAMEAQLNKNMKQAKTKERIRAKAEAILKAKLEKQSGLHTVPPPVQQKPEFTEEELIKLFNSAEKAERTPRNLNPIQGQNQNQTQNNDKKKKKKK